MVIPKTDYIDTISAVNLITGGRLYDVTDPSGPCENLPGRSEVPYTLISRPSLNPPISLAEERSIDLTPPFCIAVTATLPSSDLEYLFNAMADPFSTESVASLEASSDTVRFTLGDSEMSFGPPNSGAAFTTGTGDYVHLQLCLDDSGLTFYTNCGDPQPVGFTSDQNIVTSLVTFLQNGTLNGAGSFTVSLVA